MTKTKKQIIEETLKMKGGARQCIARLKKLPEFDGMDKIDIAMIYHDLTTLNCPNGKQYKFRSLTEGFQSCARGKNCKCFLEKVKAKPKRSSEAIAASNAKREKTNLKIHGVANIGSTAKAKAAHAKFYSSQENIDNQLAKQVATTLNNHGVENPMQNKAIMEKSKQTRLNNRNGNLPDE